VGFRKPLLLAIPPLALAALASLGLGLAGLRADWQEIGGLTWITDREGPQITIAVPQGVVSGTITATVSIADPSGARLTLLALEDRPLPPSSPVVIDTTALPDGEHALLVEAEDLSLRRNFTTKTAFFRSHNAAPALQVQVDPPAIGQGHVGTIHIRADEPFTLTAQLDGKPQPLFQDGESYWAIVAPGVEEEPGVRQLQLHAVDALGNEREYTAPITVTAVYYPTEAIALPEDVLPLLAPDVVERESTRLAQIYGGFTPAKLWSGTFITPTVGWISSEFGLRRSYNGGPLGSPHGGLDLAADQGTAVVAANAGRVVLAEALQVRGNTVVIDHGLGVYSAYFHLSEIEVSVGQTVRQGDPLGRVGSTGLSTGPHLHWEMRVNGLAVQPREWVERQIVSAN